MQDHSNTRPPTEIGIAVVEQAGHFLIGVRGAQTVLAGKAEFPGGKCEPGESSRECAVRECREETGLSVQPIRKLHAVTHSYPHGTVALEFWLCEPDEPKTQTPINGFRWVPATQLKELDFPEANGPLIDLLS